MQWKGIAKNASPRFLFACLFVCLYVFLCVSVCVCVCVCVVSLHLSTSISLSLCRPSFPLSFPPSRPPFLHLSVCLSVFLSVFSLSLPLSLSLSLRACVELARTTIIESEQKQDEFYKFDFFLSSLPSVFFSHAQGMDDYISKPVDQQRLQEVLDKWR